MSMRRFMMQYGRAGVLALLLAYPSVVRAQAPATQPARLLSLPGVIAPDERVEIFAKASGYVSQVKVDIGSQVRRGDVLLTLDVPELRDELHQSEAVAKAREARVKALQAKVEQARLMVESAQAEQKRSTAEHQLARITFERKSELFKGKAIPAQEFDVAQNALALADAQLTIAQARVAAAQGDRQAAEADALAGQAEIDVARADIARVKTLLGYTTIMAPFDGVITRRSVDPGAFVRSAVQGAGGVLLVVDKLDRVRLVIDVPEADALQVRPGSVADIAIRARGDAKFQAKVTRTALAVTSETRTMRAEIDLDNAGLRLLPGMYARVEFTLPPPATATRPGA